MALERDINVMLRFECGWRLLRRLLLLLLTRLLLLLLLTRLRLLVRLLLMRLLLMRWRRRQRLLLHDDSRRRGINFPSVHLLLGNAVVHVFGRSEQVSRSRFGKIDAFGNEAVSDHGHRKLSPKQAFQYSVGIFRERISAAVGCGGPSLREQILSRLLVETVPDDRDQWLGELARIHFIFIGRFVLVEREDSRVRIIWGQNDIITFM